jgi:hypothetical protein
VVPKVGCTAPWGAVVLPKGALEVGPSERVVYLFTIEVTLDQTLGNWYHFMALRIFINVVSYFIVIIIFLSGL